MGPGGEEDQPECSDNEQILDEDETNYKPPPSLFRFFCVLIPIHLILRGHHYIGPKAALDWTKEDPVDEDDKIAAQHTEDYQNARSWEDVRKADRLALKRFWRDLVSNWNWHSAIILLLLCAKYLIECVLSSPIYPCDLCVTPQHQETDPVKSAKDLRANQLASSGTLPPSAQCQSPEAPLHYLEADEEVYQAIDDMRYKIQDVRNHILTGSLEDPDAFEEEIENMTCRVQQLEHLVAPQVTGTIHWSRYGWPDWEFRLGTTLFEIQHIQWELGWYIFQFRHKYFEDVRLQHYFQNQHQAGGLRQRCGRSRGDMAKVHQGCGRSREDAAKMCQGCERNREDLAKVHQGCGRSREVAAKMRQGCERSREDVAKVRHRCGRSREDVAKAHQRCGRVLKDAAKQRRLAVCPGGKDKKNKECGKIEDKDRPKPSLFRTLGSWFLLQYLLPGHRYLGPGDASCRGLEEPVDEDDRIAQEHDREYALATTKQDVRRADRAAIRGFWCNLINTCNWHSILGLFIVSIKYAIESLLPRPIYPSGLSKHGDERCIEGKVIEAKSKTLQIIQSNNNTKLGPPSRCPCPGQYVGRTPQETPGHRMNRPPSPPKYFTDFSVVSQTSLTYIESQTSPYTTPGHRMSRPPSPPRVFTYDVPGQPCSRPGTPYGAASPPGSARYSPGVPLAQSSPSRCPSASSQASYSPGLSPISTVDSRDDVLNRGFNASPDATFSSWSGDGTFTAGRADATFSVCPGDETFTAGPENATFSVCPEDETLMAGPADATFNVCPADATFNVCPEDETLMGVPADATFDVGRGNETYVWTWEDSDAEGIFEDISLEDDVFEPPGCPRVKKKPPPLVIQEELNETFTMRAPGHGFSNANTRTDSDHNETFEVGSSLSITIKIEEPHNATFEIDRPHNATFEMDRPHNATFEMDQPHNATFEIDCPQGASSNSPSGGGIDDCLRERIEHSQERVRGLICKLQALIDDVQQCKGGDPNRTY